jgi:hypothetical protein
LSYGDTEATARSRDSTRRGAAHGQLTPMCVFVYVYMCTVSVSMCRICVQSSYIVILISHDLSKYGRDLAATCLHPKSLSYYERPGTTTFKPDASSNLHDSLIRQNLIVVEQHSTFLLYPTYVCIYPTNRSVNPSKGVNQHTTSTGKYGPVCKVTLEADPMRRGCCCCSQRFSCFLISDP